MPRMIAEPEPLTKKTLGPSADVAIIGAGAVGLWTAIKLAARGAHVIVVDRDSPGEGASYGNAGLLTPSLALPLARPGAASQALRWTLSRKSPFALRPSLDPGLLCWLARFALAGRRRTFERGAHAMIQLCLWSMDEWEQLARAHASVGFEYRGDGLLALYESARSHLEGQRLAELIGRCGVPWEPWGIDRVREEEPVVSDLVKHAIHFPQDGFAQPRRAMECLRQEAIERGVKIVDRCPVEDMTSRGNRVVAVETPSGPLRAAEYIIAAGAWSGVLARRFGQRIPMRSAKGYSMLLPRGPIHPRRALYLAQRRITVTPHEANLRLAGTLEIGREDRTINQLRAGSILHGAAELLRIKRPQRMPDVWSGLRPCLSDGMPMIGSISAFRNVWISTGHQMTGFKCAPASARLLSQLMCGEKPAMDPSPFDSSRFGA